MSCTITLTIHYLASSGTWKSISQLLLRTVSSPCRGSRPHQPQSNLKLNKQLQWRTWTPMPSKCKWTWCNSRCCSYSNSSKWWPWMVGTMELGWTSSLNRCNKCSRCKWTCKHRWESLNWAHLKISLEAGIWDKSKEMKMTVSSMMTCQN